MKDINEVLNGNDIPYIIEYLKKKSVDIASWDVLSKDYEPSLHDIKTDLERKQIKSKPSTITLGLEKLLCRRYNEFTFAIPVKRNYTNLDSDDKEVASVRKRVAEAIESVYKHARIDAVNNKRGISYYASCEVCTVWYAVKSQNSLYGFESEYKMKCMNYSPMEGIKLYPLLDEMGDMIAMSFEYKRKVKDEDVYFFDTYTNDRYYSWRKVGSEDWEENKSVSDVVIKKIPCSYIWRQMPVYFGLTNLRNELEYTLSRNSDVIAYNSAPILKVSGKLSGEEQKGEARRIYRVEHGGDVSYVSWNESNEALRYHVETLLNLFWMQGQMPDVSFNNMARLGNIGYDARQTLLTDAHLRIGEESGAWIEFLERECNVIKAFLRAINAKDARFVAEIDNVNVEHVITPFIQNDEAGTIKKLLEMNGGKPLVSHLESIRMADYSANAEETYEQIKNESASEHMEFV